jgi:nucleotide-binding universal stress UspA family protein
MRDAPRGVHHGRSTVRKERAVYRTIVLALDGSEGSARAVPHAAAYARRDGARIVIAHARTHAIEPAVEHTLQERAAELAGEGIAATIAIRPAVTGREADILAEVAVEEGADLIAIASRGRGPFTGAVLGSVTLRLLSMAPCPVLVVPHAGAADQDSSSD